MKVRLHARARRDLAEIRNYLRETTGANAAERVRQHLKGRIDRLGRSPRPGITTSEPGVWILSPAQYPYRIYFTVTADAVIVLHVRHTSRRLPDIGSLR